MQTNEEEEEAAQSPGTSLTSDLSSSSRDDVNMTAPIIVHYPRKCVCTICWWVLGQVSPYYPYLMSMFLFVLVLVLVLEFLFCVCAEIEDD